MAWILRTAEDQNNPTLSGGVYGKFITIGKAVYWRYDGANIIGIILISDGGKYGLDKLDSFEFGGSAWTPTTQYIFHRGTFTKQIDAKVCTLTDTLNWFSEDHGFADDDLVRLRSVDGSLPNPLQEAILGQSAIYQISHADADTYQLVPMGGGSSITYTDPGTGTFRIWKADAGFDDAEQGLPSFAPEVETTFNNMAYVEFKKNMGSANEPNWADFRSFGTGRRLMDYDDEGAELGVIDSDDDLLTNTALEVIDNQLWNYKVEPERIDWESWRLMRDDCDVDIFQRYRTDETAIVNGLSGRYYQGDDYTNLVISRLDPNINIASSLPTVSPAPGVVGYGFSTVSTGRIKPRYTELYTLKAIIDDQIQVYINGNLVIDATTVGTHTGTFSFVADELYDIEIRFRQLQQVVLGNLYQCQLKWSSATQTEEIVPETRLFPSDEIVKRSRCSTAFNTPTEASEVHERLMERIVGWHWTDTGEKIVFLEPNRAPVFTFSFDLIDDDSVANFANKTFEKKRRGLPDRKNFLLFKGRDLQNTGYPYIFIQADRPDLRRFTNGEPTNEPASDLGLIYRSLGERLAENEMVMKSDPKHTANLDGGRSSSGLRKNDKVLVKYYDRNGNFVADEEYLITLHSWGASNDRNKFSLLPLARIYYFDEPVEV